MVDPPIGPPLQLPTVAINKSPDPGVFELSLAARRATVNIAGATANLLTYNGQYPGPLVRVRRTQGLRFKFRNELPDDGARNVLGHDLRITNLHTHGLHVSPGDNANGTHADNMLVACKPGESTVYEYDLSKHAAGNLNFVHPHIHGTVTDQMWAGLATPLIVEDEGSALAGFDEKVLVLKDMSLAGSEPFRHGGAMMYMMGVEGNLVLVNGQQNPRLTIAPGQIQRWRVLNSCTARFFRLALERHTMHVVGTDGGLLDKPYPVSELLLSPGERVDLLVKADQPAGSYRWQSVPYDRGSMMDMSGMGGMSGTGTRMGMGGMSGMGMGGMSGGGSPLTLMTVSYDDAPRSDALPQTVDGSASRLSIDLAKLPRRQDRARDESHGRRHQRHDVRGSRARVHARVGARHVRDLGSVEREPDGPSLPSPH